MLFLRHIPAPILVKKSQTIPYMVCCICLPYVLLPKQNHSPSKKNRHYSNSTFCIPFTVASSRIIYNHRCSIPSAHLPHSKATNAITVIPPTAPYNPRSHLATAAKTHRLIDSPITSAYNDRPYVAIMFRKIAIRRDYLYTLHYQLISKPAVLPRKHAYFRPESNSRLNHTED